MTYGLPYKGSKSKLAARIAELLPPAHTLVDIFCGGCAVAHAAALSGKFKHIVINDTEKTPQLFIDAVHGKYQNESRWISREDFFRLKDSDPYVRFCWSFGNNGRDYLYSKVIEPYKKALHFAIVYNDFSPLNELDPEAATRTSNALRNVKGTTQRRLALKHLPMLIPNMHPNSRLQSLESLERLERLQSLQSLPYDMFAPSNLDYRSVHIPENSVIYADPPYANTDHYGNSVFDSDSFWDWARNSSQPILISEYHAPDDFITVARLKRVSTLSATNNAAAAPEHLYTTPRFAHLFSGTLF